MDENQHEGQQEGLNHYFTLRHPRHPSRRDQELMRKISSQMALDITFDVFALIIDTRNGRLVIGDFMFEQDCPQSAPGKENNGQFCQFTFCRCVNTGNSICCANCPQIAQCLARKTCMSFSIYFCCSVLSVSLCKDR